jgi:hypothetical protein
MNTGQAWNGLYFVVDEIKDDGMGGTCGMYGGEDKCRGFWLGNLKEENTCNMWAQMGG